MKLFIDIHSHILPGMDNGCETREEASAMIRAYEDLGTEAVICTPHFGLYGVRGRDEEKAWSWLRSVETSVRFYPGNQILLTRFTLEDLRREDIRTLAGSKWTLVDYEEVTFRSKGLDILGGLKWMAESEFVPVLGQPERYPCMQQDRDLLKRIEEAGVYFQVNAGDLFSGDSGIRETTRYLLENRLASFVGSNAHTAMELEPVKEGLRWIYDHCPEEYADAVVHDNTAKIIMMP